MGHGGENAYTAQLKHDINSEKDYTLFSNPIRYLTGISEADFQNHLALKVGTRILQFSMYSLIWIPLMAGRQKMAPFWFKMEMENSKTKAPGYLKGYLRVARKNIGIAFLIGTAYSLINDCSDSLTQKQKNTTTGLICGGLFGLYLGGPNYIISTALVTTLLYNFKQDIPNIDEFRGFGTRIPIEGRTAETAYKAKIERKMVELNYLTGKFVNDTNYVDI